MANLLTVDLTAGVPTVGTGTVMTLNSIAALLPAALAAHGGLVVEGVASGVAIPVSGTVTANVATGAYTAAVTLTRTSDTNAYTANDVMGAATGSTAALTFATMGPSAGVVEVVSASLEIDKTAVPSGMTSFRLYLYNVTPPGALGDNAAWDLPSGDRASFLGYIDLGTPVDLGSTLYVRIDNIGARIKLSGTSIFAYLVTNGAYTPASADVHVITLHTQAP